MTPIQRRSLLLAPLATAVVGGTAFWMLLDRMSDGTYDPHGVPSMLIGKPLPNFRIAGPAAGPGLLQCRRDRRRSPGTGQFLRLVVHPLRAGGAGADAAQAAGHADLGHRLQGQARRHDDFLKQNGDPFTRIARDEPGTVAINFGLYGVPETYWWTSPASCAGVGPAA